MKKIILSILCLMFIFSSVSVYAAEPSAIPRYIHILHMSDNFSINQQTGYAIVDAYMMIESGSYCTISAQVKKENATGWSVVHTYRASGGTSAIIEQEPRLSRGYTYKCVFTYTVYDEQDFVIEQKTFTSQEIDYR